MPDAAVSEMEPPPSLRIGLEAARSAGDLIGVLAAYSALRDRFPAAIEPFRDAAEALIAADHLDEADILLEAATEQFPDDVALAAGCARLAERRGDWPAAAARWNAARAAFPDMLEAWLGAARCQREQGLTADAEPVLRQAVARFPDRIEPWRELAWAVTHLRRLDEAIVLWEQVRTKFPDLPIGHVGTASALRASQRLAEARVLLTQALQRFPDDFDLLAERAWLASDLGEMEESAARFAVLRDRFPDRALPPLGLARALSGLGQFEEAEAAYRAGIEAFPAFDLLRRELEDLPSKRAIWTPPAPKPERPNLPRSGPLRVAVTGFHLADQLSVMFSRMLPFRGKVAVEWINAGLDIDGIQTKLPEGWLDGVDVYFEESQAGAPATRRALRALLPGTCEIRGFPTSSMRALWPFLGKDDRLTPEPPLYNGGRYMDPDAVAASLVHPEITDDALFDMYMEITESAPLDLDALYAADLTRWEAEDVGRDVCLAPFIDTYFRDEILFAAPYERGTPIVLEVARQLLAAPALREICDLDTAIAGLERLAHGWRAEGRALPVHPRVAKHFGLTWWSPDMKYGLGHNSYTFREYTIRYLRWSPWLV